MSFDGIRKKLFNNELDFDMFKNDDSDNCKDKYNNLIYLLIKIIEAPKNNIIDRFDLHKYTNLIEGNKEAILLYLHLVQDVLTNQSINEPKLDSTDLSFVTDLNGNLDINILEGKTIVLNQIRNAYEHKSGKIYFYEDNKIKKVKIDNKAWFSIEAKLDDLNNLFEDITIVDDTNDIQRDIQKTIDCIKKGKYFNIPFDVSTILKLNLLMCYNKESIFDRFMQTQTSYIDASNFNVNTTATEEKLRRNFFDKYDVFFHSDIDKQSYENEWKSTVDITNNTVAIGTKYSYNIKNMPFDNYTQKHIPIPIFLMALRDANSHGRIYKRDDKYVFYDQENQTGSLPYFYMEIDIEKLKKFLSQDYFEESILTNINEHQSNYTNSFYLMEQAESANDFSNYMDIYKTRMSGLTEADVIKYMYDNNKFSSYLMEFPGQVEIFKKYRLDNGLFLYDYLKQYENQKISSKKIKDSTKKYKCVGIELYYNFIKKFLNNVKLKEEDYAFFDIYYSFLHNLKYTKPNIFFKSVEELGLEEQKEIIVGSRELLIEFLDNNVILDPNNFNNNVLFAEVGMKQSRQSELLKIMVASEMAKRKDNFEEKRYTIKNVKKRSVLSKGITDSLYKNYSITKEEMKPIVNVIKLNIGVRVFNSIYTSIIESYPGFDKPIVQDVLFFSYIVGSCILSFQIGQKYYDFKKLQKRIEKIDDGLKKYSDDDDGGNLDEIRFDGRNNFRFK